MTSQQSQQRTSVSTPNGSEPAAAPATPTTPEKSDTTAPSDSNDQTQADRGDAVSPQL